MTGSTRQNPVQQLNWMFYNPVNGLSCAYCVEIVTFKLNKPLQYLRELFAEQIKLEHKFPADMYSVKFWKPKEKLELLSLPNEWIQDNDITTVAQFLPGAAGFNTVFPQQLDGNSLHLLITAQRLPDDDPDQREDYRDTVMEVTPLHAFHKRFRNLAHRVKSISPVYSAKADQYYELQKSHDTVIYDGFYAPTPGGAPVQVTIAPPIEIFHPVFAKFQDMIDDPEFKPDVGSIKAVSELMIDAAAIRLSESSHASDLCFRLTKILRQYIGKAAATDNDRTPDDMISKQLPDLIVPLIILELQRALGDDGWDALTQASYSVLSYWNDDSRTSIRDKCCCPTLILAGGGPYLAILGVVWTDKFIVQRLTDLMWLGEARTSEDKRLYKLARVFTALGRCYEILDHYYEDIYDRRDSIKTLIVDEPHPRFFPYYTSFKRHDGVTTEFEYVDALESDPTTVTFLAKTTTGKPCSLVIKFVDRYGFDAHDHLASHKRAPALLYCGLLDGTHDARDTERPCGVSRCAGLYTGPWRMVVMEYIDGRTAQQVPRAQWPMSAYNDVKAALTELHKANYVFGDLRQPNVMFNVKGKALLIDFDWAGTVGEVCYPKGLASAVNWPKGVTDFAPIEKEHDEAMLETYFSVKSIN